MTARLLLCETCEGADPEAAARLRTALAVNGQEDVAVETVACMGGCASPQTLALEGEGLATFVFDGIDPDADQADILATVRIWRGSPGGWIENAFACGRLRERLRARVPRG